MTDGKQRAPRQPTSWTQAREAGQATDEKFYHAFEERYRGSRQLIGSRVRVYLPFIEPLKSIDGHPQAVDLGCGRGEWLELLTENGFDAQGVDLDAGMLAACYQRGLHVTQGDAISFLKALPNESQSIVSGFHIAEHLPFSELQTLVEQSFRVLKPAGLLILETPNPENIKVSTLTFYIDPTHRNPLPPDYLSFLPEYYGFERVKVVRLQESPELSEQQTVSLDHVLSGVSPDYAVIAQKAGGAFRRLFDGEFDKDFGLGAPVLIGRFDRQLVEQRERTAALEARVEEERNARIAFEHGVLARNEVLAKEAFAVREAELARLREALAASEAWAKSLQADFVAKTEALSARDAELAGLRQALAERDALAKSLAADAAAKTEALGARDTELAGLREALAASNASANSLQVDGLAKAEALSAREAEITRLREVLGAAEAAMAKVREALTAGNSRVKVLEADLVAANERLAALLASRSWRLTAPLRGAGAAARRFALGASALQRLGSAASAASRASSSEVEQGESMQPRGTSEQSAVGAGPVPVVEGYLPSATRPVEDSPTGTTFDRLMRELRREMEPHNGAR